MKIYWNIKNRKNIWTEEGHVRYMHGTCKNRVETMLQDTKGERKAQRWRKRKRREEMSGGDRRLNTEEN